ncbi:MAG TPA: aminomethyl-transferring glycine dehydrogenase subunit GcvPB [Blastocatellia bacterium]|nr:aminomethyl-transferring glycine dehydrogenase subunit GcvPB [Blastocatellia bacterium]HMV81675.1 aminomethyl-transferring glycine dehydrogenase subunit GcvPB [Blastocatellia bacterium]HNG29633.1 aminomethyl-transferring glycine dehydrogenase subunit GcvPB [Blastocatellia bacterium]
MIKKVSTHINQNEATIFERSRPGKVGYHLPALDVEAEPLDSLLDANLRRDDDPAQLPEVSEVDVIRHFTRISTWNYAVDFGMYPLGSCTMKYNPKINERVSRFDGFAAAHPYLPDELAQGNLELLKRLEDSLAEITGLPGVSLQPAAGAQGEMTGLMVIRACLEARGNARKVVLIPDSAHGTNPASAAVCGYQVKTIKSTAEGAVDLEALRAAVNEDVAALMLTNPSTLGLFEENIEEVCRILHDAGGLVYMDGANMNALVGVTRPGDMGVDVIHLNLHKTFSTPHGGGGPGAGPIAVTAELEPFLPFPRVAVEDGKYRLDFNRPQSIGRVRAFHGNYSVLVRALCYILTLGAEGLREATETAVLNANYIAHHLKDVYEVGIEGKAMHEVIFNDKRQQKFGVHTLDIAKRLIDYGFHPMTIYFPLVVPGAIMIEPTESEGRDELDLFIDAMKSIAREAEENPDLVKQAPHSTRIGRLDEAAAARKPVLRWKPAS